AVASCRGVAVELIHGAAIGGAAVRWRRLTGGRPIGGRRRPVARLSLRFRPSAVLVLLPRAVLTTVRIAVLAGIDVPLVTDPDTAALGSASSDGAAFVGPDRAGRGAGPSIGVAVRFRPVVAALDVARAPAAVHVRALARRPGGTGARGIARGHA